MTLVMVLAFAVPETAECTSVSELSDEEKIRTRENYEARIEARRLAEFKVLWDRVESSGVNSATLLYLDFRFFTPEQESAKLLAGALSEYYEMSVDHDVALDTWFITGTTRPVPMALGEEQLIDWIKYMVEQGFAHNSVLTSYGLTREGYDGVEWSSESIGVEED